jgi:hypothetical protein
MPIQLVPEGGHTTGFLLSSFSEMDVYPLPMSKFSMEGLVFLPTRQSRGQYRRIGKFIISFNVPFLPLSNSTNGIFFTVDRASERSRDLVRCELADC